jgi:hypothetical protein
MTGTKLHINSISQASEEFLDSIAPFSEKCPQLQVFLHRKREGKYPTEHEFLMVTDSSFGKVEINDISVEEPDLVIEYRDCVVDLVGHIRINVHDPDPRVLFISWQDIRNMVIVDTHNHVDDVGLLEFDY